MKIRDGAEPERRPRPETERVVEPDLDYFDDYEDGERAALSEPGM